MLAIAQAKLNFNQYLLLILDKSNHINHLKQLHAFFITLGHGQTQFFAFKLVRFCTVSLSNLQYARSIFDSFKFPNIYLYTAMITAYASLSDYNSSLLLYRDMVRRGKPRPNQFIFPHVFKSCNAELVHTQVVKLGFEMYPVVQTALLDSYWRFGSDFGAAGKLFDEMPERNVVSWTSMISGYARVGQIGDAIVLFEEMPERDTPSWNAIIAGCTQNGLFPEAIYLFRRMVDLTEEGQNRDNMPNQVTLVCVLSACGHTGMLQLGRSIHAYIYRNGLGSNSFISNSLIDMYGKCGNLKESKQVFDRTSKRSLTSWNSMINCFALHGQSGEAISIFEEMMKHGDDVKPDDVTFVGILNACTHGGLVELGQSYYDMMTRIYKIEPQIQHYGCFIDLLGRAGKFNEAMDVIRGMRMRPDEVVWGSLLNGCKIHGRIELAEFAAKKLVEIDPNNGGYVVMLANIYVESGKWDEVGKVRKKLKEQNAYKTPGCSWIEVDKRVHQFYSVDMSHPRTDEIYTILQCLIGFS